MGVMKAITFMGTAYAASTVLTPATMAWIPSSVLMSAAPVVSNMLVSLFVIMVLL
jgi:hypothetical protein